MSSQSSKKAGLSLRLLPGRYAVCRLPPSEPLPERPADAALWSVTRTASETSLVLPEGSARPDWRVEAGWRCVVVEGPLDFELTGVLSSLSAPLAEAGVPLFALSTYDTDYLLIKEKDLPAARRALSEAGHRLER